MRIKYGLIAVTILAVASLCNGANLVVNPGFETSATTSGGWPSTYGDWNGDHSSIVVGPSSGINPPEGSQIIPLPIVKTKNRGS